MDYIAEETRVMPRALSTNLGRANWAVNLSEIKYTVILKVSMSCPSKLKMRSSSGTP